MNARRYGWRRPTTPHRGVRLALSAADLDGLPAAADLREAMPEVYDQGPLGSCTGQAVGGGLAYLSRRVGVDVAPSRLALYFDGRAARGHVLEDDGAVLVDVVSAASIRGFAGEDLWPYEVERFAASPSAAYRERALHTRLVNVEALAHDLGSLLATLAAGYPIVFGVEVFESFERVDTGGVVPMPERDERELGGHAMLAVGYDRESGHFLVRNSWGEDWGARGYCWMPFDYLLDPTLCGEAFALRAVRRAT